jgi:hypothetical protein
LASWRQKLKYSKNNSRYPRVGLFAPLVLALLLMSFVLYLGACQSSGPRITDSDPACPQWNADEWLSYMDTIDLAIQIDEYRMYLNDDTILPSIMPSTLATGMLLQHCFPEEFDGTREPLDPYRDREIDRGTYMYFDSPDGKLDLVQI